MRILELCTPCCTRRTEHVCRERYGVRNLSKRRAQFRWWRARRAQERRARFTPASRFLRRGRGTASGTSPPWTRPRGRSVGDVAADEAAGGGSGERRPPPRTRPPNGRPRAAAVAAPSRGGDAKGGFERILRCWRPATAPGGDGRPAHFPHGVPRPGAAPRTSLRGAPQALRGGSGAAAPHCRRSGRPGFPASTRREAAAPSPRRSFFSGRATPHDHVPGRFCFDIVMRFWKGEPVNSPSDRREPRPG